MSVVALPRRSARLALKRAAAFKAFNEDFRLDAPVSVRSKIMTAFAKAAIAQINHYGGFKKAPIDDPARAPTPAPVLRRSKRLNTDAYKANAEAKKADAFAQDKEVSAYLKSEALKRSHVKSKLIMEHYMHPDYIALHNAEVKAWLKYGDLVDSGTSAQHCPEYKDLVQECIDLAEKERARACANKIGITDAMLTVLEWEEEMKWIVFGRYDDY
jgi:hypothetical protein